MNNGLETLDTQMRKKSNTRESHNSQREKNNEENHNTFHKWNHSKNLNFNFFLTFYFPKEEKLCFWKNREFRHIYLYIFFYFAFRMYLLKI